MLGECAAPLGDTPDLSTSCMTELIQAEISPSQCQESTCGLLSSVVRLGLFGTPWTGQTVGRSLAEVSGGHPAQEGGKLMQWYSLGS